MVCTKEHLKACKKYYENHKELCIIQHKASIAKKPEYYRALSKANKDRRKKEHRCTSCNIPLETGEKLTCVNCGNTIKGELKYAADLQRASKKL